VLVCVNLLYMRILPQIVLAHVEFLQAPPPPSLPTRYRLVSTLNESHPPCHIPSPGAHCPSIATPPHNCTYQSFRDPLHDLRVCRLRAPERPLCMIRLVWWRGSLVGALMVPIPVAGAGPETGGFALDPRAR